MKRTKKTVMAPATLEQAEQMMSEYAIADARLVEMTAQMDQRITEIREEYADDLAALGSTRKEKFQGIQLFAEQHSELFGKRKSFAMAHGTIGFRTGTPKLKTLRGFTWNAVTILLKQFLPEYVRTVDEPAKDKLLADRENPEVAKFFDRDGVGVEVIQEEAFFIDLKKEEASEA